MFIEYTLQIYSGDVVVWNVTYSTWGANNMDNHLSAQYALSRDHLYVFTLHDGTVLGIDANKGDYRCTILFPSQY